MLFGKGKLGRPSKSRTDWGIRVRCTPILAFLLCTLAPLASSQLPLPAFETARATMAVQLTSAAPPDAGTEAGRDLFTGRRRFQNGGPACASCHSVATLPFPSGGTMAPDLTHEYSKLGPEGMHYALRTLYFPAMNALFLKRQLTDREERDLAAFFQSADRARPSQAPTGLFGGVAVFGLLLLIGVTWVSGRGRVHSVRRNLLKRAGLYRENQ